MLNRATAFGTSLALFVAAGAGGCATHRAPLLVAIRVFEDTVAFRQNSEETSLHVTAIVRNRDSRPVYVVGCFPSAERDIDGTWTTVFIPTCMGQSSWLVGSGDSTMIPITLYGFKTPNMMPKLDPRASPGRYRLIFPVGPTDPFMGPIPPSLIQLTASSPFIVRD